MPYISAYLSPTPSGFMLAGVVIAKRAPDRTVIIDGHEDEMRALLSAAYGRIVASHVMGYLKRAGKLMAKVSDAELEAAIYPFFPHMNCQTHRGNEFSDIAKLHMLLALSGLGDMDNVPEGRQRMLKAQAMMKGGVSPRTLMKMMAKDFGDDSEDDDESDDDSDGGGGNGHYNPDEPRIPAGQPGGGQWTTGEGTTTDSGSISADDVRNDPADTITQVGSITPTAYTTTQAAPASTNDGASNNIQASAYVNTNIGPNGEGTGQINIFIGGFGDDWFSQIVENSKSLTQVNSNGTYGTNYYFTYTDASQINALIASLPADTTINLIGHSYGGATAAQIALNPANDGLIDTLVTIDPVGGQDKYGRLPDYGNIADSVGQWVDVNATGNPKSNWYDVRNGNAIAGFGGAWSSGPNGQGDNVVYIPAKLDHAEFDDMMNAHAPDGGLSARQILNNQ